VLVGYYIAQRIHRDLAEIELPSNVQLIRKVYSLSTIDAPGLPHVMSAPSPLTLRPQDNEWMEFSLVLKPNVGYWKVRVLIFSSHLLCSCMSDATAPQDGTYEFKFNIPTKYPFEGPKVANISRLFHARELPKYARPLAGAMHRQVVPPKHRLRRKGECTSLPLIAPREKTRLRCSARCASMCSGHGNLLTRYAPSLAYTFSTF
jgi:hypothetical protein